MDLVICYIKTNKTILYLFTLVLINVDTNTLIPTSLIIIETGSPLGKVANISRKRDCNRVQYLPRQSDVKRDTGAW